MRTVMATPGQRGRGRENCAYARHHEQGRGRIQAIPGTEFEATSISTQRGPIQKQQAHELAYMMPNSSVWNEPWSGGMAVVTVRSLAARSVNQRHMGKVGKAARRLLQLLPRVR